MIDYPLPLVGFSAYSGTGKTTLLLKLIPLLKSRGLAIGMVKHAHHSFEIDQPCKDSYELRQAGADQMLVASRRRMALIKEFSEAQEEPLLEDLLCYLDPAGLDLVLVEGFKQAAFPKIELHRAGRRVPLLHPQDPHIIAIASDTPVETALPQFDINQPGQIADFILRMVARQRKSYYADPHHPHHQQLR